MSYAELMEPLLARRDLSAAQATALIEFLMSGEATDAQIGGVLIALRVKGCTTKELAAFAAVLRQRAAMVSHDFEDLVDTCGTGGGLPSFNLSTAAAIVAAGAGVRVAKHGNRSMTGLGSADVLEALGVRTGSEPETLLHDLETIRLVFLFAPSHHPAMRYVAKARKELGLRTIFNQLGPLLNPAGASRQLIGVYDVALMRSMGEALRELGTHRALLVHGHDGLDEISPCGPTDVVKVWEGRVSALVVTPADFGMAPLDPCALTPGADVEENALILREAISDPDSIRALAVLPNAAAAIYLAGLEETLLAAADRARMAIASGQAARKLEELTRGGEA